jgi:parallel beta-helix repeat protein
MRLDDAQHLDAFIVLNANRNMPRKRIDLTMQGFALFAKDKPANVKLYLHMATEDTGWNVLILAKRYEIFDRLIMTQADNTRPAFSDEQLNLLYNACDVGITTVTGEAWGMVSFEHAATRAAQIVPRHTSLADLWAGAAEFIDPVMKLTYPGNLTHAHIVTPEGVAAAEVLKVGATADDASPDALERTRGPLLVLWGGKAKIEAWYDALAIWRAGSDALAATSVDDVVAGDDAAITGNDISANARGLLLEGSSVNRFIDNRFRGNDTAVTLFSSAERNVFSGNQFVDNWSDVVLSGRDSGTRWSAGGRGNYWSRYRGFDFDGDGFGDAPHPLIGAFERLEGGNPAVRIFLQSPAAAGLQFAARLSGRAPDDAVDDRPLVRQPQPDSPGPSTGSAAAAAIVGLMIGGTAMWARRDSSRRRMASC